LIKLSARAEVIVNNVSIEPQIILEIAGLPIFGVIKSFKMASFDDDDLYFDQPNFYLDIPIEDLSTQTLINLAGSTTNISQQLFQDKGMASSISSITIELVDKDQLLTQIISPGVVLDDLLTKNASVYLNFGGGAHPEDSMPLIIGVVDEINAGVGSIKLSVTHPDGLKRQEVFTNIRAKTVSRVRYRSNIFNGINFQTQDRVVGTVGITFSQLVSPGPPQVMFITGLSIFIGIDAGVTTDSQVVDLFQDTQALVDIVSAEIAEGYENTPQAIGSVTLDSSTTIELDSAYGMLEPAKDGTTESYIRIDDEIIRYSGITENTLTGISRGHFETVPKTYEREADTSTFYRMMGSMKDVALKMMLSRGPAIGIELASYFKFNGEQIIPNIIHFDYIYVDEKYGIGPGHRVSSLDAITAANSFEQRLITDIVHIGTGSYIVVDGPPLILDGGNNEIHFLHPYNVWPDGLGLSPEQVDIQRHEDLQAYFSTAFFDYDFYLKDTIKGDEFLAKEVYFPSGCYALPRGGKASVGITLPPLAGATSKVLDESNIINPASTVISRSINRNFYNGVVYKFDEDAVEDKFTKGVATLSNTSVNRIKNVKNKPLTIVSKGIRDVADARVKIDAQIRRFLDRYQFGAESVSGLEVLFKTGFNIEVGDTVIYGSPNLHLPDTATGSRKFQPRIMEVQNKKMDIRTGKIVLDLLTTAFTLNSNYGVIAPSSIVDEGSTTNLIKLTTSVLTPALEVETYKWKPYLGQKVLFHSVDWTYTEESVISGFAGENEEHVKLNPPLSVAPSAGIIMDAPQYPMTTDPDENYLWKLIHIYFSPRVQVVAQIAPKILEVSPADIGKFHIGSPIRVHTEDFVWDTGENDLIVTEINGNEITLKTSIDFTVDSSFYIDGIGFPDGRAPYRLL
jgi:hypothetical protein